MVEVNGRDITHMPSRQRVRAGLARNFQNVRLMPHLTVLENLLVGQHVRASSLTDLFVPYRLIPNHRWKREARAALAECGLEAYADEAVNALPYGVRKQVDLIRATLAGAKLLMLDEPAAGLNGRTLRYPRGKVLGGCSSINGMIYMRGQSRDYDHWAEVTGDARWRWDQCLPYFKLHEDHYKGANAQHGAKGTKKGAEAGCSKKEAGCSKKDADAKAAMPAKAQPAKSLKQGYKEPSKA